MSKKDILLNYFNLYSENISHKYGIDYSKISKLRRKGFLFDRLVLERGGVIGYSFPIILIIIPLIVGYFAGIFDPEIVLEAKVDYIFWIIFMFLSTYLLDFFVDAITKVMQEADHVMNISFERHKKDFHLIFGKKGIIIAIIIAIPFILYDITGFGNPTEGWLNDIKLYYETNDNSWYPHITETKDGIGFGSILWLVIWIIPWFYFGAFIWLAFSYLIYMNFTLKFATWRRDIYKVIRDKQYKSLLGHSIVAYVPLAPFIAIKIIFQIFFIPWWSDTIATLILFIIFVCGVIISPFLISAKISKDKNIFAKHIQENSFKILDDVISDITNNVNVDLLTLLKASLINSHTKETIDILSGRIMDKSLIKKIAFAMLGPIISYLIKFIFTIG